MASVGRAKLTRGSPGMNGSLDSQLSSKVNKYKYTNTDEQILIHKYKYESVTDGMGKSHKKLKGWIF